MKKQLGVIGLIVLVILGAAYFLKWRDGKNLTADWHEYTNGFYGYAMRYPESWVIEPNTETGESVTFSDPADYTQEITVAIADPEVSDIIRQSLDIQEESEITIDEQPGTKLVSRAAEDGELTSIVIVEYAGRLYYIVGTADEFDLIIESFRFIE